MVVHLSFCYHHSSGQTGVVSVLDLDEDLGVGVAVLVLNDAASDISLVPTSLRGSGMTNSDSHLGPILQAFVGLLDILDFVGNGISSQRFKGAKLNPNRLVQVRVLNEDPNLTLSFSPGLSTTLSKTDCHI